MTRSRVHQLRVSGRCKGTSVCSVAVGECDTNFKGEPGPMAHVDSGAENPAAARHRWGTYAARRGVVDSM